jgi:hypothetical protein
VRYAAVAASALVALSVVLLPWYALDGYEPNGWDATWWARAALGAALLTVIALRFGHAGAAAALALLAAAFVSYRTAQLPDFGFGFDGLKVPVERQAGCWVALASSFVALLASSWLAWARRRPAGQEPAPPTAPSSAAAAP